MKKNVRESNFELMRIISTFMIVIWHLIVHGNVIENTTGLLNLFFHLLMLVCIVHVNSFILLSGYFNYNKKINNEKIFRLFSLQWFYKLIIMIVLISFNVIRLNDVELFQSALPLGFDGYWFINTYLCLLLISPFLNKLIHSLNQKEFRNLIIILLIIFSIIPFITNNSFSFNNGYGIVQFILMYFIGAYLHKYPTKDNYHFKLFSTQKIRIIFIIAFIFLSFNNLTGWFFTSNLALSNNVIVKSFSQYFLNNYFYYSSLIVIIQSVCYFLFFETLSFNNKFINNIAKAVLGIYLIHDNIYVRKILYTSIGIDNGIIVSNSFIIYFFLAAFIIFFVCLAIEFIRIFICNFIIRSKFYKNSINKFSDYIKKVNF